MATPQEELGKKITAWAKWCKEFDKREVEREEQEAKAVELAKPHEL